MPKKLSFPVAIIALLMIVSTVSAGFWIYSNIVEVDFEYALTLQKNMNFENDTVTLTATLTYIGLGQGGKQITFYTRINSTDGNWTQIGTVETALGTGVATLNYAFPENGRYQFMAGKNP